MKKNKIEDFVSLFLETNSFEDLLERFDLTPADVFTLLYNAGHIDEEILEAECDVYDY